MEEALPPMERAASYAKGNVRTAPNGIVNGSDDKSALLDTATRA